MKGTREGQGPLPERVYERSEALRLRAHDVIPGGCHTYAKGDDQYPVRAPGFIARGRGCHVWDVDGNRFVEYGMGLRAVTLGHAHPRTVAAAHEQMLQGNNFTRPSELEVVAAEELRALVAPGEDVMVKFGKNGSDVTSAAVRLARGHGPRQGGDRRPAVLLGGRLVHRPYRHERRRAGSRARADRRVPIR